MVLQMSQLGKAFVANVTRKRLLARMDELVALKLGRRGEFFATVGAFVPAIIRRGAPPIGP